MATVSVIGAGTMGAGIAQVAAAAGWSVQLFDVDSAFVEKQIAGIRRNLDRLVEKGKLAAARRDETLSRIAIAGTATPDLVVEAVIEDLATKVTALRPVAERAPRAVIASNTSSLAIGRIGAELSAADRTVGMHFFNPVPLMPLVEIIAGAHSAAAHVEKAAEIARSWGKTVVFAKDTPGFIVNRVARGYYLESLRMLGEGIAGVDEIDRCLKTLGGFRMGPFELMDLIGIDVNYNVSLSVWEQMGKPARLTPHPIQKDLFERKLLGRKSKQGFYSYATEHPMPAVPVDRKSFDIPPALYKAVRRFADGATEQPASITEQYIFARVLAAIINEAALALDEHVASEADIDTAMKLGTNYPHGPLEWVEKIGRHTVAAFLRELNATVSDARFKPTAWLDS